MLARTVQGLLLLGTRMFQQGNRNLLGLVMVFMAKDLGFGVGERGSLLSAIAAGYFFTQIPGGALADKMGAKLVMCAAAAAARCSHLRPHTHRRDTCVSVCVTNWAAPYPVWP
jgi:MFS family permease